MSLDDLLKGWQEDPNSQEESKKRDAVIEKRKAEVKGEQNDFVLTWNASSFLQIEFAGDIIEAKRRINDKEVDFILKWIPRISNNFGSKETLVRILILAAKPFDGKVLKDLFDDLESDFYLKWAIGNTIDSIKVQNVTEWLKSKFESLTLGKEKEMLVLALPKYLDPQEAKEYLIKIFDNYPSHAADSLAKIGDRHNLEFIKNKLAVYKPISIRLKEVLFITTVKSKNNSFYIEVKELHPEGWQMKRKVGLATMS